MVLDEFGSNLDLHTTHAWAPRGTCAQRRATECAGQYDTIAAITRKAVRQS